MFSLSDEEYDSDGSSHELYLSKDNLHQMQKERFEIFKTQDLERGLFDVTFEAEGKILHAHKFIIASVSETMNAMLSSRWTTSKDEPVKIETYSYDNFYEFLCFLYIGACKLTDENVFQLVDMAEFYGVPCFKNFCDKFLSRMKKNAETIEEIYDFADKYSLSRCMDSIGNFVLHNQNGIYNAEAFIAYKKPFIEFLSTINRISDRYAEVANGISESEFFELVYKWAEQQVLKQQPANDDESFNLQEAIKTELSTILPNIKFGNMRFKFLMDFVVVNGFHLSADQLNLLRIGYNNNMQKEQLFKHLYELAEKQGLQKLKNSDPENFDIVDSIKADLAKIIQCTKFFEMSKEFLMDFVVPKEIITEEQANHVHDTRVCVTNNGKSIYGVFKDEIGLRQAYDSRKGRPFNVKRRSTTKVRFPERHFVIPPSPSTVAKMRGVNWYLCLETGGILTFKHETDVQRSDYLLAEMKSSTEFELTSDEKSYLSAEYNNLNVLP